MKTKRKMLAFIIILFGALIVVGTNETHYERKVTVVKVKGNEVLTQDSNGNQFSFYGNGFNKKDKLILKMDNKGTTSIKDDEVLDAIKE